MTHAPDPSEGVGDDLVPVSVRLGQVVPPEDPEDWTRPLTWVAASGMLIAPAVALIWFWIGPPTQGSQPVTGTWVVAAALVVGATLVGATQQGSLRAAAGTVAAGLFAALAVVIVGLSTAGERQIGSFSPTLSHAFVAAVAGMAGALAAAPLAARLASVTDRRPRMAGPALIGMAVTVLLIPLLFG